MKAKTTMAVDYKILDGISPLVPLYDVYLLDIWGLLHDGVHPYPGVIECLEKLMALGKKTLLLSNSPRRGTLVSAQLEKIGIPQEAYTDILTSGDATYLDLMDQVHHLGRRCYFLGQDMHKGLLTDVDLEHVSTLEDADFILNTGPDDLEITLDDFKHHFKPAIQRGLLMICANPDMKVIIGQTQVLCAGTLAQLYKEQGGQVHYHGKPFPFVYELAMQRLGNPPKSKVLALGDSLNTDIKGARKIGIDGGLVLSGLHGHELDLPFGDIPTPKDVAALTLRHHLTATYYLPSLRW